MESVESIEVEAPVRVLSPLSLQCSSLNEATNVCLNFNCSKYVFLCKDKTCKCYKQHKGCIKGSIESINQAIEQKLMSIEPFEKRIDGLIQSAIDELSDFRDKILTKAKEQLNFIGLTKNERKFIKAVRTKKVEELTGKQMNEIFTSINNVQTFNDTMKEVETKIAQTWNVFNLRMEKSFDQIQTFLNVFSRSQTIRFQKSKIIKNPKNEQKLLNLFNRNIGQAILLYRASQNDFKISKFWQTCQNIKNTVLICETEYGNIIGGFSALSWIKSTFDQQTLQDLSMESFTFSLTNNDRFNLQPNSYSTKCYTIHGPIFGNTKGNDILICDNANQQRNSQARINNAYFNGKYQKDNQSSWQKFSGSKDGPKFLVKEWEVWSIKFVS